MLDSSGNSLSMGQVQGSSTHLMVSPDARRTHLYVCGGTGVGKSRFLESLVRQDIANWRKSRCGMLVIDPHGELFDSLMAWLARGPSNLPIVPIDLRRDDRIVGYNLLRRREANASVVVDNIVDAMSYVWGSEGTDATPLFARWMGNILSVLYEKGHTLPEAAMLLSDKAFRRSLTTNLRDRLCQRDWEAAMRMTDRDFEGQVGSSVNRLPRFLRNDYMRAMFGQAEASIDLGKALTEGHIVLVSLARAGARVSKENADLFATLLLNDVWTAAQEVRGKHRDNRPFYVYIDEFQRFVSPTISENLDEARGFGLHLTMAHQFPNQLVNAGASGKRLYDSVMENTNTKVVFRLTHEDNLRPMAQWLFRGGMDPDEVKHTLYSTKVMGYAEETRETESHSTGSAKGGGRNTGRSRGSGMSGQIDPDWPNWRSDPNSWSEQEGSSESDADSWSEQEGRSVSRGSVLIPVFGEELSHVQFRDLEEQLFRAMAVLFDQRQKHCVVRISDRMKAPVSVVTPFIEDRYVRPERVDRYVRKQHERWPFFLPLVEAVRAMESREQRLAQQLLVVPPSSDLEVVTTRRPVPSRPAAPVVKKKTKLPKPAP